MFESIDQYLIDEFNSEPEEDNYDADYLYELQKDLQSEET